ncbi:hypothetical protein H4219_003986, partial [Mycoemilia scoparia]
HHSKVFVQMVVYLTVTSKQSAMILSHIRGQNQVHPLCLNIYVSSHSPPSPKVQWTLANMHPVHLVYVIVQVILLRILSVKFLVLMTLMMLMMQTWCVKWQNMFNLVSYLLTLVMMIRSIHSILTLYFPRAVHIVVETLLVAKAMLVVI